MATHTTGGGIDTNNLSSAIVTRVTGSDAKPVREEELRNRFLSFEPVFDRHGQIVARELVLRGVVSAHLPIEIRRMNEDMLLTGLYSLIQDRLTGEQPLLVQISRDMLLSDALPQLNQPGIVWALSAPDHSALQKMQALSTSHSMRFCLDDYVPDNVTGNWAFYRLDAASPVPNTHRQIIVRNIRQEHELGRWPDTSQPTWFMGEHFTGQRTARSSKPEVDLRLELATRGRAPAAFQSYSVHALEPIAGTANAAHRAFCRWGA